VLFDDIGRELFVNVPIAIASAQTIMMMPAVCAGFGAAGGPAGIPPCGG
jgi:hypothetical protein